MSYSCNVRKKTNRTMRRIARMKREDVAKLAESKHIRDIKLVKFIKANFDKINDYRKLYKVIPISKFADDCDEIKSVECIDAMLEQKNNDRNFDNSILLDGK